MRLKKIIVTISLLASASACITRMPTSGGRPIDSEFVQSIQKGKTTMSEVKARLGEPATVTTSPDGVTWSYMHWEGKPAVLGTTYSSSSTKTLTIQFKNAKVADYSFSTTAR